MAEYKNGVNFRGNMSVEADDISPDVKTGRIVFVDDDLYESDTAYKAKVDKCVEEGFVKSSDIGSGGGGGAEPLIVNFEGYEDETTCDHTLAEITAAFNSGRAVYATALDGDGSLLPLILLGESGAVFELVRYSQTDTHGFVSFDSLTFEVDGEEVLVYASSNSGTFVLSNA